MLANIHSILAHDIADVPSLGLMYALHKHVVFTQCCFNFDPQSSALPDIETASGDCTVFSDCSIVMRVTLSNTYDTLAQC